MRDRKTIADRTRQFTLDLSRPDADTPEGPGFDMELEAKAAGYWPVAGTDEAGRGPVAGPVVAAAVILDPDRIPEGLNDSKKLTKKRREALFEEIIATSIVSIASSGPPLIDGINILRASLDAMRRAVTHLATRPSLVLVDGRDVPAGLACSGKAVIKGDSRSVSIAAASIVAKVTRDRMMERAHEVYPRYGFAKHAGYGTQEHLDAISQEGACVLHRMSFRPLKGGED